MKTIASNLLRWAGLSAIASGALFMGIQAVHPLDLLASVTTPQWTIAHGMGVGMGIFGLFGVAGIYARQAKTAGWLGLIGYLLLSIFYMLTTAFQFVEAFIIPPLASVAPTYVEGFLGIASGYTGAVDLGMLPTVYLITGLAGYMFGGLLFGIATFRAGALPRWAGALLAVSVVLPLVLTGLLPHPLDRILAVPMGAALVWLGYSLWAERREPVASSPLASANPQLLQTGAK